jgi:hypothetical protein
MIRQVEQDEVRTLGTELGQRLAAVGCRHDPESIGLERVDQRLAQGRLVVDDQDRSCHLPFRIAADVNGTLAGSVPFAQPLRQLHEVLDELDALPVPIEAQREMVVVERPE